MRPSRRLSPAPGLRLGLALLAFGWTGIALAQRPVGDPKPEVAVPELNSDPLSAPIITDDPEAEVEIGPPPTAPFGFLSAPPRTVFPFVPFMLGDFSGPLANPMTDIKASEGESPIPQDRVFYRFNYYANLDPSRYQDVSLPYKRVNLFTNVFGFEKAFGESFSIGVRLPVNAIQALSRGTYYVRLPIPGNPVVPRPAVPNYNSTQFGNINTLFKYKLHEDLAAGRLVSAGLALSFPTATTARIDPGPSTAAIFQPFLGYVFVRDRFFIQGFSSVTLPLVSVQPILMFNDVGLGMWAYRNEDASSFLTGFAPTIEMHLNNSLQGSDRVAYVYNKLGVLPFNTQFNMTFGGTFEFFSRATLGVGFVVPLVSPLPFDYEVLAHLNWRF